MNNFTPSVEASDPSFPQSAAAFVDPPSSHLPLIDKAKIRDLSRPPSTVPRASQASSLKPPTIPPSELLPLSFRNPALLLELDHDLGITSRSRGGLFSSFMQGTTPLLLPGWSHPKVVVPSTRASSPSN